MQSKEEILKQAMSKKYCGKTYFDFLDEEEKQLIYKAMEDYAKQRESDATRHVSNTPSTQQSNIDNQYFLQQLKDYFKNTPREKVLEDWAKSAEFDNVGPTVDDFIAAIKQ